MQPAATTRAADDHIHSLLSDDLVQHSPNRTLADDELVIQARERSGLNQLSFQLVGIPPSCLGGRVERIWPREGEA